MTDYHMESMYELNKKGLYEDLLKKIKLNNPEAIILAVNAYINLDMGDTALKKLEMYKDQFVTKYHQAILSENLVRCYLFNGDIDKAEVEVESLKRLLDSEIQDARMEIMLDLRRAKIFLARGKTEQGEKLISETMEKLDNLGDVYHQAEAYKRAAIIYLELNMKDKAKNAFETAMGYFKKLGNNHQFSRCQEFLSQL
jgi:tetratricopeptide (TPR) repeat protein